MKRHGAVAILALLLPACASASPVASPSSSLAPSSVAQAQAGRGVPDGFSPRSASFVSTRHGWVLGATGRTAAVVETRDGGRTWSLAAALPVEVGDPSSQHRHVRQVRFLDERVGWAYGTAAYVTRDGGATWREAALPEGRTLVSIDAAGERTYALLDRPRGSEVVDAAVWTGTADGETFTRADVAGATAAFENFVVRGRTVLFRVDWDAYRVSNDAGRTWATRRPCQEDESIRHVAAASERHLLFSCVAGEHVHERSLRVSRDGGRTTTTLLAETNAFSAGLVAAASPALVTRAIDADHTPGARTLQWSGDGGRTFRPVGPANPQGPIVEWAEPRFHAGTFGTVVRSVSTSERQDYAVYATTDGGRTWEPMAVG